MKQPKTMLAKIRESLAAYGKPFLDKELLMAIIAARGGGYTPAQLAQAGVVTVLKNGTAYFNASVYKTANPFLVGTLYAKDWNPVFGGMVAYNRLGFTTQVATWFRVYNTGFSGKKVLIDVPFEFVKVSPAMLYGDVRVATPEGDFRIMGRERAAIEYFREFGRLPKVLESDDVDFAKLRRLLARYPIKSVASSIVKALSDENLGNV